MACNLATTPQRKIDSIPHTSSCCSQAIHGSCRFNTMHTPFTHAHSQRVFTSLAGTTCVSADLNLTEMATGEKEPRPHSNLGPTYICTLHCRVLVTRSTNLAVTIFVSHHLSHVHIARHAELAVEFYQNNWMINKSLNSFNFKSVKTCDSKC